MAPILTISRIHRALSDYMNAFMKCGYRIWPRCYEHGSTDIKKKNEWEIYVCDYVMDAI